MMRIIALVAAIVLSLLVVLGIWHPTDVEQALAGVGGLIALAMVAKDQGW